MTNAKKQSSAKSTAIESTVEKIFTVADVARELKLEPKRARAFLRKNETLYTMRNQKFTAKSSLYKQCVDALTQYKNKHAVVTK